MISSSRAATTPKSAGFAGPSGPAFFRPKRTMRKFAEVAMSEKLSESVTIKLSPSQMRMVEGLALHEGTTTSEVIRESIADRFRLAEERYVSLKRIFDPSTSV